MQEWVRRACQGSLEKQQARRTEEGWISGYRRAELGQSGALCIRKTTTQSDAECYVQGAPRSQTGRARTATAVLSAQTSPDDSGMKSAVGFGEIMNRDDDLNQNLILA